MIITGMNHFQSVCKKKLVEWYQKNRPDTPIDLSTVFIVWSCKTLQKHICLCRNILLTFCVIRIIFRFTCFYD